MGTFKLGPVLPISEPRVGKAQAGKLEEDERSRRNCRHTFFAGGCCCSKSNMLYSLMADTAARAVSGAAYIGVQEQRWHVAKQYTMMCVHIAISDLSC